MGICMRYSNNYLEAEEIVNDSFLKIFKSIHNFQAAYQNTEASLVGWMKKIIIHTAIDSYRKNNKPFTLEQIGDNHLNLFDNDESSIDKMSYKEIIELVQKLSPTYRTVFNLYVIDGFKHEEIADQLGISVGTSKSNLAKARINVQKMLKQTNIKLYEQRKAI
ncbi:MAG: sigma-70 family RNA polymerase sigma factor [Chitinophagaceae bacterium]|nr:sigma-70 family RNA polymerase sigma factor [Chitinophagaceae bacterium]